MDLSIFAFVSKVTDKTCFRSTLKAVEHVIRIVLKYGIQKFGSNEEN